jgi:hypothetical protein
MIGWVQRSEQRLRVWRVDDPKVTSVVRQPAQSGKLDYAAGVVLHESSQTRVTLVPFYIPHHTGPSELHAKIITYKKLRMPGAGWRAVEEKSVTLDAAALGLLLDAIKVHQLIAERSSGGQYIVIKTPENTAELGNMDPQTASKALLGVLSQPEILKHVRTHKLDDRLADALRGAIRLREVQDAVEELRGYLDGGVVAEESYQKWCRRHSWAFGISHMSGDDVRHIGVGDTVDVLLPTLLSGLRDVVELKRPDVDPLAWDGEHGDYYFTAEASKAIGQAHRYLDTAADQLKSGLTDHPEIIAYHPRATIVIGRSKTWPQPKLRALHGLNSRLHGITVMTFDHLLRQADQLMTVLTSTEPTD